MLANPKKSLGLAVLVLMVGGGLYAAYQWNKTPESTQHQQAKASLLATDLLNRYRTNPEASNRSYLNQILEVTGICSGIENQGDTLQFLYMQGEDGRSILCQMEQVLSPPPPQGQEIRCKGVCTGYDSFTEGVGMDRCVLVGTKP